MPEEATRAPQNWISWKHTKNVRNSPGGLFRHVFENVFKNIKKRPGKVLGNFSGLFLNGAILVCFLVPSRKRPPGLFQTFLKSVLFLKTFSKTFRKSPPGLFHTFLVVFHDILFWGALWASSCIVPKAVMLKAQQSFQRSAVSITFLALVLVVARKVCLKCSKLTRLPKSWLPGLFFCPKKFGWGRYHWGRSSCLYYRFLLLLLCVLLVFIGSYIFL